MVRFANDLSSNETESSSLRDSMRKVKASLNNLEWNGDTNGDLIGGVTEDMKALKRQTAIVSDILRKVEATDKDVSFQWITLKKSFETTRDRVDQAFNETSSEEWAMLPKRVIHDFTQRSEQIVAGIKEVINEQVQPLALKAKSSSTEFTRVLDEMKEKNILHTMELKELTKNMKAAMDEDRETSRRLAESNAEASKAGIEKASKESKKVFEAQNDLAKKTFERTFNQWTSRLDEVRDNSVSAVKEVLTHMEGICNESKQNGNICQRMAQENILNLMKETRAHFKETMDTFGSKVEGNVDKIKEVSTKCIEDLDQSSKSASKQVHTAVIGARTQLDEFHRDARERVERTMAGVHDLNESLVKTNNVLNHTVTSLANEFTRATGKLVEEAKKTFEDASKPIFDMRDTLQRLEEPIKKVQSTMASFEGMIKSVKQIAVGGLSTGAVTLCTSISTILAVFTNK